MDDATLSERLMRLGLSEKEVDTYLTVLEQGEVTASEISDATGVSKRYVYSISEALEERGFVDVDDHVVPTKIRARDPDEVIELLTEELSEMEPALSERHSNTERTLQQFDVVKSRRTMIKRIRSLIADAENEITLSISHEQLPEIEDELRAAVDRGVLAMVLVSDVPADALEAEAFAGIATLVRTWDQITPLTLTVDQQYAVVAPVDMMTRSNSDLRAISLAQRQIVPVLTGSFFGNYWPMAAEAYVDDPRPLPAEHGCFRHAVLDATLHLRDDRPVGVEAAVTSCRDTENRTSIEGTVIGTHQGLVEPATNDFPVENSLVVKTNNRRVTVGGPGAMLEDFEAKDAVTLTEA
ncbi:TrmB family transcriptional regulator [Halosimplex sp. J119]